MSNLVVVDGYVDSCFFYEIGNIFECVLNVVSVGLSEFFDCCVSVGGWDGEILVDMMGEGFEVVGFVCWVGVS